MYKLFMNISLVNTALVTAIVATQASLANADSIAPPPKPDLAKMEEVFITGSKTDRQTLAGSAMVLDESVIAKFDSTDVNDLISQVPGVYIRYEDGYGLRPNIGIRGVTSDRSQKITLMEDGILISPSPYSAPAAYYFPNVNRMQAVEVVKGPAAIHHGPHTIGGAVNMVTRGIPEHRSGEVGVTLGSDNFQKYRLFYGDSGEHWGYWIDGLHYSADGFKELDGGGDTGFERNDINAKVQWQSDAGGKEQRLVLKFGYADEDSDETYLGLTDNDFNVSPTRRYTASQLDKFESDHQQFHALYSVDFNNGWKVFGKAYVQRFNRSWDKFDGFLPESPAESLDDYSNSLAAQTVLSRPDLFPNYIGLLRGDVSSNGNTSLLLDITNNDREYGSQGLELNTELSVDWGSTSHLIEVGVRFHHDYVERDHRVRGFFVENSELVFDGVENRLNKALNEASTDALALFISDKISVGDLTINAGVRFEDIEGEFDNQLVIDGDSGEAVVGKRTRSQDVVAPGLGLHYQLSDSLGILAGAYKGFSPAGPSSGDSVDPEEAINYEYGVRYQRDEFNTEVIGFFSDYSNLIGRCRASDAGCISGDEFNGGEVEVSGVELTSAYRASLGADLSLPLQLAYTYTESAFQSNFQSNFSQWGLVRKGDSLPYLPENQLRAELGLDASKWSLNFALKYVDEMREVPGQGSIVSSEATPAYTTYDLAGTWRFSDSLQLQLVGSNLSDKQVIVARRPFGARPNQPRTIKAGVTYKF